MVIFRGQIPRPLATLGSAALLVLLSSATGLASRAQSEHAATEPKQTKFAVVSIRPNKTGGQQLFGGPTPDGYEMKNMFLAAPILSAYLPQTGGASAYADDQVIGMPAWATSDTDHYDIRAKVDEADLADWQNPAKQPALLRAMLQSMLVDRLKLKVHRSTKEGAIYLLVLAKNGPNFKPSDPATPHPGASPFPGGGMLSMEIKDGEVTTHFYGITSGQLALSLGADRPVHDRTGLTGTYDLTLRMPATPVAAAPGQHQQDAPPEPELSPSAKAAQLGLKLEPAQGSVETLVIDHIERPSEN